MMSETTLGFLSTLTYRADAKRQVCWLPLGGIYWEDEMPDIRHLMNIPEDDRNQIFRLFTIRLRLWKGEPLPDAERMFWDRTYSQVPSWAFFRRQQISDDDQHAQEQAEQGTADALEALLADADRVSIRERWGSGILCDFRFDEEADSHREETLVVGTSIHPKAGPGKLAC